MERPEEKKNDQVVEKIPDNLLNPIIETQKIKGQLHQQFHQISINSTSLQQKSLDTLAKMQSNEQAIGNKIKRAFDKMKLGKKKSYTWRYDGKGNFVGVPRPEPKKEVK